MQRHIAIGSAQTPIFAQGTAPAWTWRCADGPRVERFRERRGSWLRPAGKASKRGCPACPICRRAVRRRAAGRGRPAHHHPQDRRSAQTLGTEREGHGVLIDDDGLIRHHRLPDHGSRHRHHHRHRRPRACRPTSCGYDYESGFGLVRTERPIRRTPMRVRRFLTALELRSEAYRRGLGGEKATLKVKVAGRREFAGYWEYLLDNAIFTVPAYPLWGGSALIGQDGTLLGVGSLLVQEALGPGAPAFPGNMYVPINRLKPIFQRAGGQRPVSTPPRAVARPPHGRAHGPARDRRHLRRRPGRSRRAAARRHPACAERRGAGRRAPTSIASCGRAVRPARR